MNKFQLLVRELEEAKRGLSALRCRVFNAETNVQLLKDAVHVAEVTGIVKQLVLVG